MGQQPINMADENWAEAAPQQEQEQDWGAEELAVEEDLNEPKLFGKRDLSEVQCMDMALADYINFDKQHAKYLPHNSARFNKTRFRKAQCHIVERLVNAFMQKGRNNGKKMLSMRIIKHAFEIIHVMTAPESVERVPCDDRLATFRQCEGLTRLSGSSQPAPRTPPSETSKPLPSAWPMSS